MVLVVDHIHGQSSIGHVTEAKGPHHHHHHAAHLTLSLLCGCRFLLLSCNLGRAEKSHIFSRTLNSDLPHCCWVGWEAKGATAHLSGSPSWKASWTATGVTCISGHVCVVPCPFHSSYRPPLSSPPTRPSTRLWAFPDSLPLFPGPRESHSLLGEPPAAENRRNR